jgi:nicotinamide-nucleotide amidase
MNAGADIDTLAAQVIAKAQARGLRIATAESCTGGLIAAALTAVPGSSAVVEGGLVTYSNGAKIALLGVAGATLVAKGAVSQEVAREMALGAQRRCGADLAVSVTGIAGPGGATAHKPVGRVCFGLAGPGAVAQSRLRDFGDLGRAGVRAAAVAEALGWLLEAMAD